MQVLGVNRAAAAAGNAAITNGRDIPWLQDVPEQDAWARWGARFDDLVLLDADNRVVEVYNLVDFDLSAAGNRDALKARLRQLASP